MAYNVLKCDSSVKGSFSDKQFMCLLQSSNLDKIVNQWRCSQSVYSLNYRGTMR